MENRSYALLTGLFVILLGIALIFTSIWVSGKTKTTVPYMVVTKGSISGLSPYSTVYYRGIEVGQTNSIEFARDGSGEIRISIEVGRDVPITKTTYASLRYLGVTGLAQINLNDDHPNSPMLPSSKASPARIPLQPSFFDKIQLTGEQVLKDVQQMTGSMNKLLNDDTRQQLQQIVGNINESTMRLNQMSKDMQPLARSTPALATDARQTLSSLQGAIGRFDQLILRGNDFITHADQLRVTGQSASEELLITTLPQLNDTLEELRRAARNLAFLSGELQRDPSALLLGPQPIPPGPGEREQNP